MFQKLRRAGGSLVMTVPKTFIEQNQLREGSQVALLVSGGNMTVSARRRPTYQLSALLAEMPEQLPLAEGWDAMPAVGAEIDS